MRKEAQTKTSLVSTQFSKNIFNPVCLLPAVISLLLTFFFFFSSWWGVGGRISAANSRHSLPPLINKTHFCREQPEILRYQIRHLSLTAPPRPSTGQRRENHVAFSRAASGSGWGRGGQSPRGWGGSEGLATAATPRKQILPNPAGNFISKGTLDHITYAILPYRRARAFQ